LVPPGADVGALEAAYNLPAILNASLRRRPTAERAAA
jgi:aryl-alcohol dehydrogenase (NADP+)